jgi:hypothetical protein
MVGPDGGLHFRDHGLRVVNSVLVEVPQHSEAAGDRSVIPASIPLKIPGVHPPRPRRRDTEPQTRPAVPQF